MSEHPDTDRLVPALRAGDSEAFRIFCTELNALVRTSIIRYVKCEEDIQELISETFLRAHRGMAGFRGDSSLRTWVWRIAGNLAMNRYNYNFRRRKHLTDSLDLAIGENGLTLGMTIAADQEDHRDEIETGELEQAIRRNLPLLEPSHRQILALITEEHLPYDKIAARLRLRLGTVKSRVARARLRLRQLMAEEKRSYAA